MIRFILIRETRDRVSGASGHDYVTIDADVPQLEEALRRGGYGEDCYDHSSLVGCEVRPAPDAAESEGKS